MKKKVMREICKQRRKQERTGERFVGLRKQKEWGLSVDKKIRGRLNQKGDLPVEKPEGDL